MCRRPVYLDRPAHLESVDACVDLTLRKVGRRVVLGAPLGIGKPNQLVNAFYRRAAADPRLELEIVTALSLRRPAASSELERRLLKPLAARLFGEDYPRLEYAADLEAGELPANVKVTEFYLEPGRYLGSPQAQRGYVSANYTHVARDFVDRGANVVVQLVARGEVDGAPRYSLGSNPDITLDLLPLLRRDSRTAFLGQVHPAMPFMPGDGALAPTAFDAIVEPPDADFPLFAPPNEPVDAADYLIGLYASALVRDGGTLQLGIGSLGDAVTALLKLRHRRNGAYRELLDAAGAGERCGDLIARVGGVEPFSRGLYAATEMLADGFLELYASGILKRRVYPHAALQRLLDSGAIGERVSAETLARLVDAGIVPARLDAAAVELLRKLGVLRPEVRFDDGRLLLPDGSTVDADLSLPCVRAWLGERGLGRRLRGGVVAHAGFFLGPRKLYETLRSMDFEERALFAMTRISFVNELYGDEELKRAQRRDARFLNSGMIATLLGAVVSDGLADGRMVSGVGGQFNFVAMAHALADGRSVIMIPATRLKDGRPVSNVRYRYGHVTIPRHLRDLVVTEYGVADLRGKTDEEVVAAMLGVADSRFQDELLASARRAGKIARDYRIPDRFRANLPERIEELVRRRRDLLPRFPYGTDLTAEEVVLGHALKGLGQSLARRRPPWPRWRGLAKVAAPPRAARPYLERLGLERPAGWKERLLRRAVVYALVADGAV